MAPRGAPREIRRHVARRRAPVAVGARRGARRLGPVEHSTCGMMADCATRELLAQSPKGGGARRFEVKGRLCFGREASPAARVLRPCALSLWSPSEAGSPLPGSANKRAKAPGALERRLPGLFAQDDPASPVLDARSGRSPAADGACCICLDEIAPSTTPLSCPHCSMRAHPKCLARWFGSSIRRTAKGSLPSSAASCPCAPPRQRATCGPCQSGRQPLPRVAAASGAGIADRRSIGTRSRSNRASSRDGASFPRPHTPTARCALSLDTV